MTYEETIDYLFNAAPLFQQLGAGAYKEGLQTTLTLDEHFGHPHRKFRTIHIAGTNGKGSCSHTIAAVLQQAGYRVGLYTSPHLVDFRERIRVNGEMIPEEKVIQFVEQERPFFEPLHPSFFELATSLAFKHFADEEVDVAVIEVGLGGRLDCTNIIRPELCVITNISFDHIGFLGDTFAKIAAEKAGIIKPGVPVVIGESLPETAPVFRAKATEEGAPITFADAPQSVPVAFNNPDRPIVSELRGACQEKNTQTILTALDILQRNGFDISYDNVLAGFAHVCRLTGLRGRWQLLQSQPIVRCDTGHNVGGWQYIVPQLLAESQGRTLRMVFGMVSDKDISTVLSMLPHEAEYYFCQASVKRALACDAIAVQAATYNLHGHPFGSVAEAYQAALTDSSPNDYIFVGGSSFVVADLLAFLDSKDN